MPPPVTWPAWSASSGPSRLTTTAATLLSGKIHPPAAPAAGRPTWPPSAQPSARPSRTPATCTSPKADATTPPRPKPSASTASIRTDADIHGTRRSPGGQGQAEQPPGQAAEDGQRGGRVRGQRSAGLDVAGESPGAD